MAQCDTLSMHGQICTVVCGDESPVVLKLNVVTLQKKNEQKMNISEIILIC